MRDMADELLKLYAAAQDGRGLRVLRRQQLAARVRRRLRVHGDQGSAHGHPADQARHGKPSSPWTACCAAMSDSARPKSPCARRSRRWATANRWRCSRRPRCSRFSISRPSSAAFALSRCAWRCSAASVSAKEIKAVARRDRGRQSRHRRRNAPAALERCGVPRSRACWSSMRSSASASATRSG